MAQRCNKHNELVHDYFVSYRVSTDHINAEKLAAHLDGKKRPDGENFVSYLDKNCLIQGKDWEAGFTYGINNSKALVLLISDGLVKTMISKAKRGETDNVLKEHKIALQLKKQGRLIIPVFVATLGTTPGRRDCYIKLNRPLALRLFDAPCDDPDVSARLAEVKGVLEQIFQIPDYVNIEPDSIADQIPKILQLWYAHLNQKRSSEKFESIIKAVQEPGAISRLILNPSQSFRLVFVGTLMGLLAILISLSLMFIPSKSKKFSDLKLGVAIGNIVAFAIIMLACIIFSANRYYVSTSQYCTSCENIILSDSTATSHYINKIPNLETYFEDCLVRGCYNFYEFNDRQFEGECLACICYNVYQECEAFYSTSITLILIICVLFVMSIGTAVIAARFIQLESFSTSLM